MRTRPVLLLVLASLVSTYAPAHAAVDDAGPGVICQYTSTTDPTAEPGTQTGDLSGGPLVLTDSTTNLPGSGVLTCRVQVNTSNHTGTGPQVQGYGRGVVTAGPSQISYSTTAVDDQVYLCAEFTDDSDGTTYYWDDTYREWSTNSWVNCGLAISVGPGAEPSDDSLSRTFCSTVSYLPSPLDRTLQGAWDTVYGLPGPAQDYCANGTGDGAGPESAVTVVGVRDTGVFLAAPGVSCDISNGSVVGRTGTANCTVTVGQLRVCKEVEAAAAAPAPANALVSASITCGNTTASATADGSALPPVAFDSELLRSPWGSLYSIEFSWNAALTASPTAWAAAGGWNLCCSASTPSDTSGSASATGGNQHVAPAGTVHITKLAGQTSFDYAGFTPALSEWTCTEGASSVTCSPPARGNPHGCDQVTVSFQNHGTGTLTGTSGCASGPAAQATSAGPAVAPSADTKRPGSTFAWTCSVNDSGLDQWEITCSVGA